MIPTEEKLPRPGGACQRPARRWGRPRGACAANGTHRRPRALDIFPPALLHSPSRGRGEAGYRAGLSSRRPRVQVPSLPLLFSPGRLCRPRRRVHRSIQRAVAQLVARSVRDRKAGGSNPPSPKLTAAFFLARSAAAPRRRQVMVSPPHRCYIGHARMQKTQYGAARLPRAPAPGVEP